MSTGALGRRLGRLEARAGLAVTAERTRAAFQTLFLHALTRNMPEAEVRRARSVLERAPAEDPTMRLMADMVARVEAAQAAAAERRHAAVRGLPEGHVGPWSAKSRNLSR